MLQMYIRLDCMIYSSELFVPFLHNEKSFQNVVFRFQPQNFAWLTLTCNNCDRIDQVDVTHSNK